MAIHKYFATADRSHAVYLINEEVLAGAAKFKAWGELDINIRIYQRCIVDGGIKTDGRPKTDILPRC
jgi:hypothetical protein